MKGFEIKTSFSTIVKKINNIEEIYNYLVFKNKKIDDVLHKNVEKRFISENKKISQNVKNLFHLRVEIYKTLIIKYEESIAERVKLRRQKSEKKKNEIKNLCLMLKK